MRPGRIYVMINYLLSRGMLPWHDIVNKTVVNGYEINDEGIRTGTTLWGNKNSMSTDKLNVVVDGVVISF